MANFLHFNEQGLPEYIIYCATPPESTNGSFVELSADIAGMPDLVDRAMLSEGQFLILPPRPSAFHEKDIVGKCWRFNANFCKISLRHDVRETTNYLLNAPIKYEGALFDANTMAVVNLSSKIEEVRLWAEADSSSVESLVWRDFNNEIHRFEESQNYLSFLRGLLAAISSRNSAVYAASWEHKAKIDAETDDQALVEYSTSEGWPT